MPFYRLFILNPTARAIVDVEEIERSDDAAPVEVQERFQRVSFLKPPLPRTIGIVQTRLTKVSRIVGSGARTDLR